MRGQEIPCEYCGTNIVKKRFDQRFCGKACHSKAYWKDRKPTKMTERLCRHCGLAFQPSGQNDANRQHCSQACSVESARKARKKFHSRNPEYNKEMWRRHGHKDKRKRGNPGILARLRRKYPDLPCRCESCGEARVLDVAHKPEFARNGAWRTMAVMERHMFWILCPTCHAVIDRLGADPATLGLR